MDMRYLIRLAEGIETEEGAAPKPTKPDGGSYPERLKDNWAISDYILEYATNDEDADEIADNFEGCHAVLKLCPVDELVPGDSDHTMPHSKMIEKYKKLPIETMPPIVVEDDVVQDGNHRLKVAKELGFSKMWCYEVVR
jgi:hypothetical protein